MMRYISPLRYPGGKARLSGYINRLICAQDPKPKHYAEPFCGGAGAALKLLVDGAVERIHLNDADPGVAAFWRCVFGMSSELASIIRSADVTIDAWRRASAIYSSPIGKDDLELGFATFFLNRCNRSGILRARPIGGFEQTGKWKMDARFNREALAERIEFLGNYSNRVSLSQQDGREHIRSLSGLGQDVIAYVDPPYLVQGDRLYMDSLSSSDHTELSAVLSETPIKWLLTYDAEARITEDLYSKHRCMQFEIAHSAQVRHLGIEYAVFSDSLTVPEFDGVIGTGDYLWLSN
ncbi:DNA adenine methylase [Streptomyces sp. MNU89]|uniref:DNA adenine methylase n=1 Tax=Streptomyces sp. MNU89 TaxID=2560025 RepID=UPI001E330DF0|nr:DNA adenine methylase [Streptomyces sp. MNU89]MCC9739723.1 DNA adenine methylase [Streptomyces sp. MNU89]